jgi:hypothetical protein
VHGAGDYVTGGFIEVVVKQFRKLQILRPQDVVKKPSLQPDHDGGVALAWAAVWLKVIATYQCQKELAFPWIGQGELEFDRRLRCSGELGLEAFWRIRAAWISPRDWVDLNRASTLRIFSMSSSRVMVGMKSTGDARAREGGESTPASLMAEMVSGFKEAVQDFHGATAIVQLAEERSQKSARSARAGTAVICSQGGG